MRTQKELEDMIKVYELISETLVAEGIEKHRIRPYVKLLKWVLE